MDDAGRIKKEGEYAETELRVMWPMEAKVVES
jgi:hypothetical protein